jgi:hypothetical protein
MAKDPTRGEVMNFLLTRVTLPKGEAQRLDHLILVINLAVYIVYKFS